jgi:hypothetical protein
LEHRYQREKEEAKSREFSLEAQLKVLENFRVLSIHGTAHFSSLRKMTFSIISISPSRRPSDKKRSYTT